MNLSFSTANVKNARFLGVDMLRGAAILLVLCRHWYTLDLLSNIGWMGVDLFFVISGFLIGGLLLSELDKQGKIDYVRFFMRRGLKIYPLFFLLITLTFLLVLCRGVTYSYRPFLFELLFIQNYLGGLYVHTWSLAVEEHFYVVLLACSALFVLSKKNVVPVCLIFMIIPLMIRIYNCLGGYCHNHFYTHTRIDSLFTGVLLYYGWRYHHEKLLAFRNNAGDLLPIMCVVFLACFGFIAPYSSFTQGVGFTVISFFCAGLLLFVLGSQRAPKAFARPFILTGFYSYSIYLAHIPVKMVLEYFGMEETSGLQNLCYFIIYVLSCVLTGIVCSELIEQPLLRWRDKIFPSKA